MKTLYYFLILLWVSVCIVMPGHAFVAKSLTISLGPTGDAEIEMQYDLSLLEQSAVFLRIADPAAELQKAFNTNSALPVTVTKATGSSAVISVPSFATIHQGKGKQTIVTPSVSFAKAERVMNGYWFAPLVNPDFSPQVTTIVFPDGYRKTFNDTLSIPPISRSIST